MDFFERMEKVFNYIEDNLEEDIDISSLAGFLGINADTFKRTFVLIYGIPISEYIKKRKLSVCVKDLKKMSVLDVAIKYGYNTTNGFSLAFKNFHGFSPSEYKTGMKLNAFLPFSRKTINEKFVNYSIEKFNKLILYGEKICCQIKDIKSTAKSLWKKFLDSKTSYNERIGVVEYLNDQKANYWACSDMFFDGAEKIELKEGEYLVFNISLKANIKNFSDNVWKNISKSIKRNLGDFDIEIYEKDCVKLCYKFS